MTSIDTNRLKGNYAELTVATWLSRVALVRPVAEGTDVGVDYYCESVIGGTPHLHFWAQVKAIPRSHISHKKDKETAWFDFKTKHLQYWARQPIPVYAFLVPVEGWPPSFPKRIYGIRITEYILRNGVSNRSHVRIKTSDSMDTETIESDLAQFITEIVPWDTSALLIQKGIIAPINTVQVSPERRFPSGIGFKYLDKVLENIRDASVMGLQDALIFEHYDPSKRPLRVRFEDIAKLFEDEMHLLGLSILVRAAHTDGAIERAKSYTAKAMKRVAQDPRLDEEAKSEQIAEIRLLLEDFK